MENYYNVSSLVENIQSFVEEYVLEAYKAAERNPTLTEFDETIRKELSSKFRVDEKVVLLLHHPFHWNFFLKNPADSENSVFKLENPIFPDKELKVRTNGNKNFPLVIANNIFSEYQNYFRQKLNHMKNDYFYL